VLGGWGTISLPRSVARGNRFREKEFYDYTAKYVDEGSKLIISCKKLRQVGKPGKFKQTGDQRLSSGGWFRGWREWTS